MAYKVLQTLGAELINAVNDADADKVFILTDSNVAQACLPRMQLPTNEGIIIIPAGEESKTLGSAEKIWRVLTEAKASRRSLLVNIGGGMISDLGGFAAALYKRGIRCINVSTSLLGAVDASIGGKTGVDFCGLKNQIGVFKEPLLTLIPVDALNTLPDSELLSGYGEMLKTGMLSGTDLFSRLLDPEKLLVDKALLADAIADCLRFKQSVVDQDPHEKGLRKILNLGHTVGHAFESLLLEKGTPVAHGIAIAHGLLPALILSRLHEGFDPMLTQTFARFLAQTYPPLPLTCADTPRLLELMANDKKNTEADTLNFVLLSAIGSPLYDQRMTTEQVQTALELRADLLGL